MVKEEKVDMGDHRKLGSMSSEKYVVGMETPIDEVRTLDRPDRFLTRLMPARSPSTTAVYSPRRVLISEAKRGKMLAVVIGW